MVLFYVLSNIGDAPDRGPALEVFIFVELIIVMLSFFFFLVLYAIGALLNYMSAAKVALDEGATPAKMRIASDEDGVQLEITPLQRER